MIRRTWVVQLLILMALVAACGSSGADERDAAIAEIVEQALPNASEFQAEILEDGEVTFEEYERSVLATLACAKEAGLEVMGPDLDPDGIRYDYLYRGVDANGDLLPDSVVLGRFDGCYARYGERVDSVYFAQHVESFGDAPIEIKEAYADCLAGHGIDIPPSEHVTVLLRAVSTNEAASDCQAAADDL